MTGEARKNKQFYLSLVLQPGTSPEATHRLWVHVGSRPRARLHEWTLSPLRAPGPDERTGDVVVIAPQCRVEPLSARLPWPPGEEQFCEFFLTLFPEEVGKRDSLWVRVELLTRNREVESVQEELVLSDHQNKHRTRGSQPMTSEERRAAIRKHLIEAGEQVPSRLKIDTGPVTPGPLVSTWSAFLELMEHSEYALAWDVLAGLDKAGFWRDVAFWHEMARAARLMMGD